MPLQPRKSEFNDIRDGVVYEAEIAAVPNLHDGAIIHFRPIDILARKSMQFSIVDLRTESKNEQAATVEYNGTLDRISEWDVCVPLEAAKKDPKSVNAALIDAIYRVVWGLDAALRLEKLQKN